MVSAFWPLQDITAAKRSIDDFQQRLAIAEALKGEMEARLKETDNLAFSRKDESSRTSLQEVLSESDLFLDGLQKVRESIQIDSKLKSQALWVYGLENSSESDPPPLVGRISYGKLQFLLLKFMEVHLFNFQDALIGLAAAFPL